VDITLFVDANSKSKQMMNCPRHYTFISSQCSTDTPIMEPCRVRNVSDTHIGHVSCELFRICHVSACRVHFNVVMYVQIGSSVLIGSAPQTPQKDLFLITEVVCGGGVCHMPKGFRKVL